MHQLSVDEALDDRMRSVIREMTEQYLWVDGIEYRLISYWDGDEQQCYVCWTRKDTNPLPIRGLIRVDQDKLHDYLMHPSLYGPPRSAKIVLT